MPRILWIPRWQAFMSTLTPLAGTKIPSLAILPSMSNRTMVEYIPNLRARGGVGFVMP